MGAEVEIDLVRLNLVPGMTPRAFEALLDRFGSARAVLTSSAGAREGLPGVGRTLRAALATPPTETDAKREIRRAGRLSLRLVHPSAAEYPALLRQIPDPPRVLYVSGRLPGEDHALAVVGARRASVYGRVQAERYGAELARAGAVVVSGLARGVDGIAHRGALDVGGRTGGVLGCGLDRIYPPEHRRLAREVAESGFLCTEFPLGSAPRAHHFPMRNRIIAGMARGVVVVEGKVRSGSLITARLAADFGRNVFAVPGRVDSDLARGPHSIIREGAILVDRPAQVLEDSGLKPLAAEEPEETEPADPVQRAIFSALDTADPKGMEEILDAVQAPAPAVLAALTALEFSGRVRAVAGRRYVRKGGSG